MPLPSYISNRLNVGNLSIIYDTVGSPVGFDTKTITLDNGYSYSFETYAQPRAKFNIGDRIYKKNEWEYLKNFFYDKRGSAIAFRWKNYGDYKGNNELIGNGDGVKKQFQLTKNYDGYSKIIQNPVDGTVQIFVDGTLVSGVTVFSDFGIVVFAVAPASGAMITATFEFDLRVRFDGNLSGRLEAARTRDNEEFISVSSLAIVELIAISLAPQETTQSFSLNLGEVPNADYLFTVTPPSIVLTWSNVKSFLVSGIADDIATVGTSPSFSFVGGSRYNGPTIQIGSGAYLSGVLTQASLGPCYVNLSLIWRGFKGAV